MLLTSQDLKDGDNIDPRFAFGRLHETDPMQLSDNLNPQLCWASAPEGTRSFAIICVDPDVPTDASDVNQAGKWLSMDLPRGDFFHWVMVDVPVSVQNIDTGSCSAGVIVGGKPSPAGPAGSRQGLNDYTLFMAGSEMAGHYFGYDGPCPPWNDERLHHYSFTVFALAVESLELADIFDGRDALKAMQGQVLDEASITGSYTLNPKL